MKVHNLRSGDTITHPVVLLRGESSSTRIDVPSHAGGIHSIEGRFTALVEFVAGDNQIRLAGDADQLDFNMRYDPQPEATPFIRTIYMVDATGNTDYQTPDAADPQDFAEKLNASMSALQAFIADAMHRAGYGHRTFRLERADSGRVRIHVLETPCQAPVYYAMDDQVWYETVDGYAKDAFDTTGVKNVVVAAYTRLDRKTGEIYGHTALGGDELGLFGSASMFSWPGSIQAVVATFTDGGAVDPIVSFDDSCGRSTIWSLASTTLGATIHEIGHCFGLPHCDDSYCIMTRGFDHLNRAFTCSEPPSATAQHTYVFRAEEVARLCTSCASTLAASPWILE